MGVIDPEASNVTSGETLSSFSSRRHGRATSCVLTRVLKWQGRAHDVGTAAFWGARDLLDTPLLMRMTASRMVAWGCGSLSVTRRQESETRVKKKKKKNTR